MDIKQWCGVNMTDKMIRKVERFHKLHATKCANGDHGYLEIALNPGGSWGCVITKIRCLKCGAERDITDPEIW
jgi:hypothetical protein